MSEEQRAELLKTVEDCGAAEMPIAETCIIAEISPDTFDCDEELAARYQRGQLKTKLAVRQAVVKGAKEGLPQMVKIYLDFNAQGEQPAEKVPDIPEIDTGNAESGKQAGEFADI